MHLQHQIHHLHADEPRVDLRRGRPHQSMDVSAAMPQPQAARQRAPPPAGVRAGPPAKIANLVNGHSTAKAAVDAGAVKLEYIVDVAMEDGEVMAWLLATIPQYAKEKDNVEWRLPLHLAAFRATPQFCEC